MRTQEELARLHREAEQELKRIPGVVGVAYGEKRRGGKPTGEIGFCVYVRKKKPTSQLQPAEIIPSEYKGIPTDVDELDTPVKIECEDKVHHSTLIGGITITNLKRDASNNVDAGTLGLFGAIDGAEPPDNVVLISCNHVLITNGAKVGDSVYQQPMAQVGGVYGVDISVRYAVARIHNEGMEGNFAFQYPGESSQNYWVDATSAQVNVCISSWCNTNCGETVHNEIRGLNVSGSNAIVDVDRVKQADIQSGQPDYVVFKVGRRTSRTVGKVSRLNVPLASGASNVIEITATENNCNGELRFGDHGDSGSAVINAQGKVIGLLYAVSGSNTAIGYACHIHPVLKKLGVTAITNANPPPAIITRAEVAARIEGPPNQTPLLRARFLGSPEGARIADLVDQHRREVVQLVNHNRRVAAVWHRNKGPAFLNRAIHNARDPEQKIPRAIEGVTREALLERMADVLSRYGTAGLSTAIAQNRSEVLAYAAEFDSLHELVDCLCERQVA